METLIKYKMKKVFTILLEYLNFIFFFIGIMTVERLAGHKRITMVEVSVTAVVATIVYVLKQMLDNKTLDRHYERNK